MSSSEFKATISDKVIIAIISALASYFGATGAVNHKLETMQRKVMENESKIDSNAGDIASIRRLYIDPR